MASASDPTDPPVEPAAQPTAAGNAPENFAEPEIFDEKDERLQLARLQTARKTLAEKKDALNQKFLELMEEKEKLESNVDEEDEKSVLEYNKSVKILNIKIKQYKKEKKNLQAEIETYNNLIRQSTAN